MSEERGEGLLAKVIVTPKPVVNDPQGLTVKHGLRALGFGEVEDVRVGKYIEIRLAGGRRMDEQVDMMCRQLLANGVIEDYRFEIERMSSPVETAS